MPLPGVAVADTLTVADTVDPAAGALRLTVAGAADAAMRSDVVQTSKVEVPCVQSEPGSGRCRWPGSR